MNIQIAIAQLLEDAADYILARGLYRGELRGFGGQYCTIGALYQMTPEADRNHQVPNEAVNVLERYLRAQGMPLSANREGQLHPVAEWSDNSTDDFEVIDALRHCAKDIRNSLTPSF